MRDARGCRFEDAAEVMYLKDGSLAFAEVIQVIDVTGELILQGFDVPVWATGFLVAAPKPPEALVMEALRDLFETPTLDQMAVFVVQANEALADTDLWVWQGAQAGRAVFIGRRQQNRTGHRNYGAGVGFVNGVLSFVEERDTLYINQDFTDREFIAKQVMDWVEQMLKKE